MMTEKEQKVSDNVKRDAAAKAAATERAKEVIRQDKAFTEALDGKLSLLWTLQEQGSVANKNKQIVADELDWYVSTFAYHRGRVIYTMQTWLSYTSLQDERRRTAKNCFTAALHRCTEGTRKLVFVERETGDRPKGIYYDTIDVDAAAYEAAVKSIARLLNKHGGKLYDAAAALAKELKDAVANKEHDAITQAAKEAADKRHKAAAVKRERGLLATAEMQALMMREAATHKTAKKVNERGF